MQRTMRARIRKILLASALLIPVTAPIVHAQTTNQATQATVFATHEFAAKGSIFPSDGAGSFYREPCGHSLVQQTLSPKHVFKKGITLESGTRVRSLKIEKFGGENRHWAHYVVVVNGPNKDTRGWCADSILVQATR